MKLRSGSSLWTAASVMLTMACARPVEAAPKTASPAERRAEIRKAMLEATEQHKKARAALEPAEDAYRQELIASLKSPNPYERRLALQRLNVAKYLLNEDVTVTLVPVLEENTQLYSERCAEMIARLSREYGGQGEELEFARCQYEGGVSNGELAAQLIGHAASPLIMAYVRQRPHAVEAVMAALGHRAHFTSDSLLTEFAQASDDESRAAVLRLLPATQCQSVGARDLNVLSPYLASGEPRLRRRAALAILRLSDCFQGKQLQEHAAMRAQASALLAKSFEDLADAEVMAEAPWLGHAAEQFVPALVRRYDRMPAERVAIIRTLGATGYEGTAAVPKLISILKDEQASDLHSEVLKALAQKGPVAGAAQASVLGWLGRTELHFTEGLEALASMGAELDSGEFSKLRTAYRKRCARAGSIFMFDLDRDERCRHQAEALQSIAERSGLGPE